METGKVQIKNNKVYFKSNDETQLIKVVNVSNLCKNDIIKNSSCKAEIDGNLATIVELIKL